MPFRKVSTVARLAATAERNSETITYVKTEYETQPERIDERIILLNFNKRKFEMKEEKYISD